MTTVLILLTIQGVMGAFDNLWHHELTEALPSKPSAWRELRLHAARAFIYAVIFMGLGWSFWFGALAVAMMVMLVIEVAITLWDFLEEDLTRKLPPLERILHTLLAVNYGVVLAVLLPILWDNARQPTGISYAYHGWLSWIMTLYAVGIFAWAVRDLLASMKLRPLTVPEWRRDPICIAARKSGRTVLVTGGSGFIGGYLVRRLLARGDEVIVQTRDGSKTGYRFGPHVRTVTDLSDIATSERIDAVVNLTGEPVIGLPWTARRRGAILSSRLNATDAVLELVRRMKHPPSVLINASAIGYYADRGDTLLDETAEPGSGFAADLTLRWEARARVASAMNVRTVLLRLGVVLARDAGALPNLVTPARLGLAAVLGSGRQWLSWIHIEDAVGLICHAMDNTDVDGPLNAVATNPVRSDVLQRKICDILGRPLWLRIPENVLRIGLGEMSAVFLDSARVMPAGAATTGFTFRFTHVDSALSDLLGVTGTTHNASAALSAWTGGHEEGWR